MIRKRVCATALAGFSKAQMPVEVAHSRLELASALVTEHPEVAMSEARAALEAFDRLQAARHADAAAALLRTLGVRTATAKPNAAGSGGGLLTKREAEVLELIGLGLSNPEIAERLFISRKTVEHHVGNILVEAGPANTWSGCRLQPRVSSSHETRRRIGEFPDPPARAFLSW